MIDAIVSENKSIQLILKHITAEWTQLHQIGAINRSPNAITTNIHAISSLTYA
ncbi:hypothetical protein BpOF4_10730 [Alkalihalophilus pseudofirmus OF4]|uniref:Uncharacterized protein n=1 Tax=Alkalihalophilus pseudofirmus (strain ATCC BAA-2126 / JCM 17055 / OF4) TaxID=398511 RepID=D3FUM9_ALKPO|nr:hypothetical protein BpOF4_10730 [Alkalihalophilus pseudofirmus OF4]